MNCWNNMWSRPLLIMCPYWDHITCNGPYIHLKSRTTSTYLSLVSAILCGSLVATNKYLLLKCNTRSLSKNILSDWMKPPRNKTSQILVLIQNKSFKFLRLIRLTKLSDIITFIGLCQTCASHLQGRNQDSNLGRGKVLCSRILES